MARPVIITNPDDEVPQFHWRRAPEGYATARQLRAMGLRPGGQQLAATLHKPRSRVVAHLYRVELAKPKRTATAAQLAAARKATAYRHLCRTCGHAMSYIVPKRTDYRCFPCFDGTPVT